MIGEARVEDAASSAGESAGESVGESAGRRPGGATIVLAAIIAGQVMLLVALAWASRHQIDADAVAYLRIAHYYATGQTDLMISGYWGPMLSWIIAALLPFVADPLVAARVAMIGSALVFTLGSHAVLRVMALPPRWVALGTAVAAVMSARYSVFVISPDLLVSGLMGFAASRVLAPDWSSCRRTQVRAGVLAGVAFMAKAVALPVLGLLVACVTALTWALRPRVVARRPIAAAAAVTLGVAALTATPWITVLSLHYGVFVFSTSARVGHAALNPDPAGRGHPIGNAFAWPEPGRLTTWEEPTSLTYHHWSPLGSWRNFKHQIEIVGGNSTFIARYLSEHDWLRLGVFAVVVGLIVHWPWRRNLRRDRWRWAGLAVFSLCLVYLPVFAIAERYYFFALPFGFAASAGLLIALTGGPRARPTASRGLAFALVAFSFAGPHVTKLPDLLARDGRAPACLVLAHRLQSRGITGTVAADHVDAAMVAYFLDQPCCGNVPFRPAADYLATGADLVIVGRHDRVAGRLVGEPELEDLDPVLFTGRDEAQRFPLRVFRRRDATGLASGEMRP